MSDLIRGGQITLHKFRMLVQVSKVIARICLVLVLASVSYTYYKNITQTEWKVGIAWVKKDIFLSFDSNRKIQYHNQYGFEKTVPAKELHSDTYVMMVVEKFEATFDKANKGSPPQAAGYSE